MGFLGDAVVKNPPANAGIHGFEPWSGKMTHAVEQLSGAPQPLSLRSRAREPQLLKPARLEPVLRNEE